MTTPAVRSATSSRAARAKARQSRRPSRLGSSAGSTPEPDYLVAADAGFPDLLRRTWQAATAAPDLQAAVNTLLTLNGHVPAEVQLRGLRLAEEAALKVLCGVSWREDSSYGPTTGPADEPDAFLGELGLITSGRIVVRVPSQGPLDATESLVDGVLRVPWPAQTVAAYQKEFARATEGSARSLGSCREWLESIGKSGRDELLESLKDAAQRTAPFVLYQEDKQYTNFRDRNTLTGKTLWPGHPDCALSSLQGIPLELWSDSDSVLVVCLALLVRSAGYARIEEANGTQVTVDHTAYLLERTRRTYNGVAGHRPVPAATSTRIDALQEFAAALGRRRREIAPRVQLYREIHGALMHKIERIARPHGDEVRHRDEVLCSALRERLPVVGTTLDELGESIAAAPSWLCRPHGDFATGLESLIYETVSAARPAFDADFAMSRGLRSLSGLVQALRAQDWEQICAWELPEYFCCVVPAPRARRFFGDSGSQLADMAWAMSARMQYNSWHFIAGNLPKVPVVVARDHFVPPTIPDLAYYSDQHHHGHVAARVRFSIRSPQPVEILGRTFQGFVDLRLLRCDGPPFGTQDLIAAQRASGFIAGVTGAAAALAAAGENLEIRSFDAPWHWATIAGDATGSTESS